jgi:Tol biopolymer transport system component
MRSVAVFGAGLVLVAAMSACRDEAGEPADAEVVSLATDSMMHFNHDIARDGRIAFAKPVNGASAVFIADSSGKNQRKITNGVWDDEPRFSPDGKWIAFNRDENAQDVYLVPSEGGAERVISADPGLELLIGWMPDNSGIIYGKITPERYETWVYSLADSSRRLLVDAEGGVFAIPSPDGKWIAWESVIKGVRTIWVRNAATGARKQLTTEGYESLPAEGRLWSHDSRRLLYVSTRSGMPNIWSVDIETGKVTQVTSDVRGDFLPVYEPNGSRVAFLSNRGGQVDVWVVTDTGGQPTRVTDTPADEFRVLWTADGKDVVVLATNARSQLFTVSADSGGTTPLTKGDFRTRNFSLSEDGKTIAFEHEQGGDVDIYTMPLSGGTPTMLASSPARDFEPRISPDGKQVLFTSTRNGESDIFIVPSSGGTARALTTTTSRDDSPRWSPDGKWISFRSNRSASSELWIMDTAGGNLRKLTSGINVISWGVFSSDSKRIAVMATAGKESRVMIYDVATGASRSLPGANLSDPMWSPDDSLLVVSDISRGFGHIEIWTASGQKVRRLTTGEKSYARGPSFSPDGKQVIWMNYEFATDYYDLVLSPVEGGPIRRLTQLKGYVDDYEWVRPSRTVVVSGQAYKPEFYKKRVPAALPITN